MIDTASVAFCRGSAVADSDGVPVCVEEAVPEQEGVTLEEEISVPVELGVPEMLWLAVGVPVALDDVVHVKEGEPVVVRVGVAEPVVEGVMLGVAPDDSDGVADCVWLGVTVAETEEVSVVLVEEEALRVSVEVPVPLAVRVALWLPEGVTVCVEEPVPVRVGVSVGDGVREGVSVGEGVRELVRVRVDVLVLEMVPVPVSEGTLMVGAPMLSAAAMSTGLTPVVSLYPFMKPDRLRLSSSGLEPPTSAVACAESRLLTTSIAALCIPAATADSLVAPMTGGTTMLMAVDAATACKRRGPPLQRVPPARTSW